MKTDYKATFSNGTIITRSSVCNDYTHAWLVMLAGEVARNVSGFATTGDLAEKAMNAAIRRHPTLTTMYAEVIDLSDTTYVDYKAQWAAMKARSRASWEAGKRAKA